MRKEEVERKGGKDLILKVSSLFEGEFSIDWLEELTGIRASSILSCLETEVSNRLLLKRGQGVYLFKDNSRRKEILDSIPEEERTLLHEKIARLLLSELSEDDSRATEVASHLMHLQNGWRECKWLLKAGELHLRSCQTGKAIQCFRKALTDLASQEGENEDWLFVKAAVEYANITTPGCSTEESLNLLRLAKERASRLKNQFYEILLDMHIARYEWIRSDFETAKDRFREIVLRVSSLGIPELVRYASIFKAQFLYLEGRFRDVVETYESSIQDLENLLSENFSITSAISIARSYAMIGQLTQGLGMLHSIRSHCLQSRNLSLSSHAAVSIAMVMLSIAETNTAIRYLEMALKEAQEGGNYYCKIIATFLLSYGHYLLRDRSKCLCHLMEFLRMSEENQVSFLLHPYLMEIWWAMENGDLEAIPGFSPDEKIRNMLRVQNQFIKGIAYRYDAMLLKKKGSSPSRILRSLTLSAQLLRDSGSKAELAKTLIELSHFLSFMGREKRAKKVMEEATQLARSMQGKFLTASLGSFLNGLDTDGAILEKILNLLPPIVQGEEKAFLRKMIGLANEVLGAERGALFYLDERGGSLRPQIIASKNLRVSQLNEPGLSSLRKIVERVASSGEPSMERLRPLQDSSIDGIGSYICVPVTVRGRRIAVLYHDSCVLPTEFGERHLKILNFLASQIGLYLDNLKAHEQVERLRGLQLSIGDGYERGRQGESNVFEPIVGTSPAIQRVLTQINMIAKTDVPVLLYGETGVGKNLVAEVIHRHSQRSGGPFVTVHCTTLTETLITSELFGHEKGAFTGAIRRKPGKVELAHKGTLFLDEIGDLSLDVQARLLRVLQTKEFERVGGNETIRSDFRLIAATNKDLEQEIKAKRFREDLFYRINIFPIFIPPLRERREDVPLLAYFFLRHYSAKFGKRVERIPEDIMEWFLRYDWPGNVRELENIIQKGVIWSTDEYLELPSEGTFLPGKVDRDGFPSLLENEKRHILEALRRTGWKIYGKDGAAELLRIKPSTLASRMKKLGISKKIRLT